MNAPETMKPATQPISLAHKVLLKSDDALCAEEIACAILGGDKPSKIDIKSVAKQLKQLADLGMIEMEPRAGGVPFYRLIAAPAANAQRDEFTLLGLIADIRAAAGDPAGRLMQDELVQHIAGIVKERDDLCERLDAQIKQWQADTGALAKKAHRLAADLKDMTRDRDLLKAENLALKTLDGSMPGFGAEHQEQRINSLTTDVINTRNALTNAINEADRLRAELATERQAREALQDQSGVIQVAGYIVRAAKRKPRTILDQDKARDAALSAIRAGAQRAEVFAIVPIGAARRGAEWRDA